MLDEGSDSEVHRIKNNEDDSLEVTTVQKSCRFKCPLTIEPLVFAIFLSDSLGVYSKSYTVVLQQSALSYLSVNHSNSVTANFILLRTCQVHFKFNISFCNELTNSKQNKSDIESLVQPYSALMLMGMSFLSVLLPAISSFFVGPWSDYNGRKTVLLVSSFGYFLKYVLLAVFTLFPSFGPEFGLVAVLPVAVFGGMVNFISTAYAYVSDISTEEKRFIRISLLEAVIGLGVTLGLIFLTFFFKPNLSDRFIIIYGLCAVIILITMLHNYFFVPDSLTPTEDAKGFTQVFELSLFVEMLYVCFRKIRGINKMVMLLLIACLTICISVGTGNSNVLYLFTRIQFNWNIQDYTFWACVTLPTSFIGMFIGVVVLKKWLKMPESVLGLIAFAFQVAASFFIAFIPPDHAFMMFFVGIVTLFGGVIGPVCRSILSNIVPKEDLGKVFALTSACESIFPLIFGPLYTVLYNATLHSLPSAFVILSGVLYILCCVFFIIIRFAEKSLVPTSYSAPSPVPSESSTGSG